MAAVKGGRSLQFFVARRALSPPWKYGRPPWSRNSSSSSSSSSPSPSPWASQSTPRTIRIAFPTSHIRTPLTHNGQTIQPPIYTKPPKLKKRGQPIEYTLIPRSPTHAKHEKSPYGANRYRAVVIDHLPPGTTLLDLTRSIAETAPVGPITSVSLLAPPRQAANGLDLGLGARIEFGRHQATVELARAVKAGRFRIRGQVPTVSRDKGAAYHWNNARRIDSRVVLVRGRPGTEGFSEEGIRAAMEADAEALGMAGEMGSECEPVVTYEVDDGCVTMEWRFFSSRQAAAMRLAIERHFGERLEVYKGHDPCWVDEQNEMLPWKLNREQAWRHD